MSTTIDYGNLMHRAMRGLIQDVLTGVSQNGLPGQHHFFITFDTMHPDVEIADWLSDRYPNEMTVVMQHWYDGLEVTNEGFSVTLNFGENPEPLYIPMMRSRPLSIHPWNSVCDLKRKTTMVMTTKTTMKITSRTLIKTCPGREREGLE